MFFLWNHFLWSLYSCCMTALVCVRLPLTQQNQGIFMDIQGLVGWNSTEDLDVIDNKLTAVSPQACQDRKCLWVGSQWGIMSEFIVFLMLRRMDWGKTALFSALVTNETPFCQLFPFFLNLWFFQCHSTIHQKRFEDISRILKAPGNSHMVNEMGGRNCSSFSTMWAISALKTASVATKLTLNARLETWREQLFARHSVIILKLMLEFVYFQTGILRNGPIKNEKWLHKTVYASTIALCR